MTFNKSEAVRNAEKFLAQGKIRQAVNEYQEIVKRDPDDITNMNILGDLLVKSNQTNEALKCFCKVAEHYNQKGFPQKAIAVYNKIYRYKPDCTDTLQKLAELHRAKGAVAEARTLFKQLAGIFEKYGDVENLISSWQSLTELDKQNSEICIKLGELCRKHSRSREAADAFAEAGDRLFTKNSLDLALESYSNALEEDPEHIKGFQGYVRIALIRGTYADAVDKLEDILNDQPENPDLRELLAECYLEMGEVFKAEDILMGLVTQESSRYRHLLRILKTHITNGEVRSAMRILSLVADHILSEDNPDRLLDWTNEILARDHSNLDALRLQARYYTSKGDVLSATAILDQISVMASKSVTQSAPLFNTSPQIEVQDFDSSPSIDGVSKEVEMFDAATMPDYTFEGQSHEMDSVIFGENGIDAFNDEGEVGMFAETAREFVEGEASEFVEEYSVATGLSPSESDSDESVAAMEDGEIQDLGDADASLEFVNSETEFVIESKFEYESIVDPIDEPSADEPDVSAVEFADHEAESVGTAEEDASSAFEAVEEDDHGFEIVAITHETIDPRVARRASIEEAEEVLEEKVVEEQGVEVEASDAGLSPRSDVDSEGANIEIGDAPAVAEDASAPVEWNCTDFDFASEASVEIVDPDAESFEEEFSKSSSDDFDKTAVMPSFEELSAQKFGGEDEASAVETVPAAEEFEPTSYEFESTHHEIEETESATVEAPAEFEFHAFDASNVGSTDEIADVEATAESSVAEPEFEAARPVEFESTSFDETAFETPASKPSWLEFNDHDFTSEQSAEEEQVSQEVGFAETVAAEEVSEANEAVDSNAPETYEFTVCEEFEAADEIEVPEPRLSFDGFIAAGVSEGVHFTEELEESSSEVPVADGSFVPQVEFGFTEVAAETELEIASEESVVDESLSVEFVETPIECAVAEVSAPQTDFAPHVDFDFEEFEAEVPKIEASGDDSIVEEPIGTESAEELPATTYAPHIDFDFSEYSEEIAVAEDVNEELPVEESLEEAAVSGVAPQIDFELSQYSDEAVAAEDANEGAAVEESVEETPVSSFVPQIDFDFSEFDSDSKAVEDSPAAEDVVEPVLEASSEDLEDFGEFNLTSQDFVAEGSNGHFNANSNGHSNGSSNGHAPEVAEEELFIGSEGEPQDSVVEEFGNPWSEEIPIAEEEPAVHAVEEAISVDIEVPAEDESQLSVTTESFESRIDRLVAEMDLGFIVSEPVEPVVEHVAEAEESFEVETFEEPEAVENLFERFDHNGRAYLTDSLAVDDVEPELPTDCEPTDFIELPVTEEAFYPKLQEAEPVITQAVAPVDEEMEEVSELQARENRLVSLLDSVDFFINEGFFEVAKNNFDAVVAEFGHRPQFADLEERLALFTSHFTEEPVIVPTLNSSASLLSVSPELYDPDFPELSTLGMYTPDEIKEMVQVVEIDEDVIFDYETFYDTATAYREMGLLDYAVREFENALKLVRPDDGTRRFFQCCNMLGHCFMEYGQPELAVMWFRRAQEVPGLTGDEELALLYEIAKALEAHGKTVEAENLIGRISASSNGYHEVNDLFRKLTQN